MTYARSEIVDLESADGYLIITCACGHQERVAEIVVLERITPEVERYTFVCPDCNRSVLQ